MEQQQEGKKVLTILQSYNLRDLADKVNHYGITKDDIVTVLSNADNGYFLLYYK